VHARMSLMNTANHCARIPDHGNYIQIRVAINDAINPQDVIGFFGKINAHMIRRYLENGFFVVTTSIYPETGGHHFGKQRGAAAGAAHHMKADHFLTPSNVTLSFQVMGGARRMSAWISSRISSA